MSWNIELRISVSRNEIENKILVRNAGHIFWDLCVSENAGHLLEEVCLRKIAAPAKASLNQPVQLGLLPPNLLGWK